MLFQRANIATILLLIALLASGLNADYANVNKYIARGDLKSAENELAALMAESFTDWQGAYLRGVLQRDGLLSVDQMEKALLLCNENCEELIARLAAAYYTSGMYAKVIELYEDKKDYLNNDTRSFSALWFTSQAYIKLGNADKASDLIKKAGKGSEALAAWAGLLGANCRYLDDNKKEARREFNQIISGKGNAAIGALYNRTYLDAKDGDMDMALTGFNMLKQSRNDFLGSNELLILMSGDELSSADGRAEKVAGIRYTIQLGTFSDKDEALDLMGSLKKDGWTCYDKLKYIDGRPYWIVTVGSFATIENAQNSKKTLESRLSGTFQIVIKE
jgi:tetratricopeptide (TPR) repeat protein